MVPKHDLFLANWGKSTLVYSISSHHRDMEYWASLELTDMADTDIICKLFEADL